MWTGSISDEAMEGWLDKWIRYTKFYLELAVNCTQYSGTKMSKDQIPTFSDYNSKTGTQYDYLNQYYATDYYLSDDNKLIRDYSNCITKESPPKWLGREPLYRVYYSYFGGVQYNFRYEIFNPSRFIKDGHGSI